MADPGEASVEVVVSPSGAGHVLLGFGADVPLERLLSIGHTLPTDGFGHSPAHLSTNGGDGTYPLLRIDAAAFSAAAGPRVRLDLRRLCQALLVGDTQTMLLSMSMPHVSHRWDGTPAGFTGAHTEIRDCADAPEGFVLLDPQPWRWWLQLALVLACLLADVVLFVLRRRPDHSWRFVQLIVVVVLAASIGGSRLIGSSPDDLAVAGRWTGVGPWLLTVGGIQLALALVLAQLALEMGNRDSRRLAG